MKKQIIIYKMKNKRKKISLKLNPKIIKFKKNKIKSKIKVQKLKKRKIQILKN